ncbi:bifunctional precorrin-2 dehydrogenase/sirohydrochlorin ferrochelatase [Haloplanus sp. GCM10025708]|uniref:precorrin-2 dehydrogenase/sirohydrochlorin ferrochelatase family protein n=1 Tax=Haloferacaceae TaxID=1644056 RepID=UPI00361582CC
MIPLFFDFTDRTILIFGGGPVGARKARRFASEAHTVVVSPSFAAADFGDAELIRADPAPDDVAGWVARTDPALVVAATDDDAVNDAAARAARERGRLVNRADAGVESRDLVVPATVEDGPVTAAVATGGRAPALSRYLKGSLADAIDGSGVVATVVDDVRARLDHLDAAERRETVRAVVGDDDVWRAAREDGSTEAVRDAVKRVLDARGVELR